VVKEPKLNPILNLNLDFQQKYLTKTVADGSDEVNPIFNAVFCVYL
jgi:hypothetical protein